MDLYVAALFILLSIVYVLSFAGYNLRNGNKTAAVGVAVLAFLSAAIPLILLFVK